MSRKEKRMIRVGRVDELDGKNVIVESLAGAAIMPGTLVEQSGDTLIVDTRQGGEMNGRILVANKDELRSRSVDDAWTVGDQMQAVHGRSADILNILGTIGEVFEYGEPVVRGANGLVTPAVTGAEFVIGHADEDITTAAGDQLVRIRLA